MAKIKHNAFTLAEVLITLAIIGVVAALTLPSLTQYYKKCAASTALRKFYSAMSQAILLSQVDNGDPEHWDFTSTVKNSDGTTDYETTNTNTYKFLSTYILPYIRYDKLSGGVYTAATETKSASYEKYYLHLSDSSVVTFWLGDCMDMLFDVNGEKEPNIEGKDIFRFTFCFNFSNSHYTTGFYPYLKDNVSDRESALSKCKSNALYCCTLLWYDNWEFKDDYPYKL